MSGSDPATNGKGRLRRMLHVRASLRTPDETQPDVAPHNGLPRPEVADEKPEADSLPPGPDSEVSTNGLTRAGHEVSDETVEPADEAPLSAWSWSEPVADRAGPAPVSTDGVDRGVDWGAAGDTATAVTPVYCEDRGADAVDAPDETSWDDDREAPLLRVDDLELRYGEVTALRGVSLEVHPGEMVALLGANGAGKTSTLRALSGMVPPAGGTVVYDGEPIGGTPAHRLLTMGISHMPDGRELFSEMSVYDNLKLGYWPHRHDRSGFKEALAGVYELFPRLEERASQKAGTMSGGEQQMLTAARAMISSPRLLLVDELSLGLAPQIVDELFRALKEVNKTGTAVILVEQFVHLALANTSRAYVLAKGEVVLQGASSELADSPDLMTAYMGESTSR